MDKNRLKTFATQSRKQLIEDVKYSMTKIGITKDKITESISDAENIETFEIGGVETYSIYDNDILKRKNLIDEINIKGYNEVVEEVAYTWFNRMIAIRYMEVNNYLPTRTRVLSSEIQNKIEPDIITEALDIDLNYTHDDIDYILKLKDENKLDELFQFLFIKQCNKLNDILPNLFEKTDDYYELLLNITFTNEEGIVRQLVDTIPEEDFTEGVEIIGWLYQYYNSDKKDYLINNKKKISKPDVPIVTQLFTTDWIVKYMVDNSLGRYWIERNPDSDLKNNLKYYLDESNQNEKIKSILQNIQKQHIKPEEIKLFDPCMGSGHILIYAFDIYMDIYKELGYFEKDIPEIILKNNLYGLDIDNRAYQLAYFALLMKARSYNRDMLKNAVNLNIYTIEESNEISLDVIEYISKFDENLSINIKYLLNIFVDAKEKGSLIKVKNLDYTLIGNKLNNILKNNSNSKIDDYHYIRIIQKYIYPLIKQAQILSSKYDVVVTNPPYLNISKCDKSLQDFSQKEFKDYSKDTFSMFIYRNFDFCKKYGFSAFMTPYVWMFIKYYQKLRQFIIEKKDIISLIQLEYNAFSEAKVPICSFILSNAHLDYNGIYVDLSKFTGGMDVQNQKLIEVINNSLEYKYIFNTKYFTLPGNPIIYSESKKLNEIFENNCKLNEISKVKAGLSTGNNDKFLRYWHEVNETNIDFNCISSDNTENCNFKWFPLNKGGSYRKWYGNQEYVINWKNKGYEIKNFRDTKGKLKATIRNEQYYFNKSISWSEFTMSNISFRYYNNFIFDGTGPSLFINENLYYYLFGFLNSNVCNHIVKLIAPTVHYTVGNISSLPIILDKPRTKEISTLVLDNIKLCKEDWDDYEISWNFMKHPFIRFNKCKIEEEYNLWNNYKECQFNNLINNEIKLNRIFNEIYQLNINPNIKDKYVSINLADYENDIRSFISYAVGCMFGRYSLDEEGLVFAGGEFDLSKYSRFVPDNDNIIPILDTEYFDDDIVNRFIEFIKACYGEEYLEDNLRFIANGLKENSNKSSREVIRDYFLKDFFKDHSKMYHKRPIYWQFSSGRQNGFNCLIYLHRYDSDTVARVRTEYLHKVQKALERSITNCDNTIENPSSSREKSSATKLKNKLLKQLDETREYDEALAHIANQSINLDLDDGVKVNYEKFQNVEVSQEGHKTKKINLLKKI